MATNKPMRVEATLPKALVPWESSFWFPLFHRLSHELDTMFDRFGFERPLFENMPTMWTPEMEIVTRENELLVKSTSLD